MYKLEYIRLKNFGTHVDSTFKPKEGITMIFGKNLDEEGLNGNGAGKSHLFEAITKLIHNRTFKKVNKQDLIKDGESFAELEGVFKGLSDRVLIRRTIKRSGSDICLIEVDGVEQKSIVDKDIWIENRFGVSYEDFVNYFVIGQRNTFSIFEAGDAYMKKLIAKFTNTGFLEKIIEELKSEAKENKEERDSIILETENLNVKIKTLKDQNSSLKEEYLDDLEEEYLEIGEKIKQKQKDKKKYFESLEKANATLKRLLKDNEDSDVEINTMKLQKLKDQVKLFQDKIFKTEKNIRHIKSELSGAIACPDCGHKFLPFSGGKTRKELQEELSKEEKSLAVLNAELDVLQADKTKEESRINKLKLKQESKLESKELLEEAEDNATTFGKMYASVKGEIKKLKLRSDEIEVIIQDPTNIKIPQVVKNKREIKDCNIRILNNTNQLQELNGELENFEFWEVAFGNKGFKAFLVNKTLGVIEGYTNYFLKKFKTSFSVRIDGFKENKDGSVQDRITTMILRGGEEAGVYAKFSGGEKRRIDICGVLAMRQMIFGNLEKGQGLNILGLDEPFEGLDDMGQVEILKMLDNIKTPVFATTHLPVTSTSIMMNSITVVKKGEVSKIKK